MNSWKKIFFFLETILLRKNTSPCINQIWYYSQNKNIYLDRKIIVQRYFSIYWTNFVFSCFFIYFLTEKFLYVFQDYLSKNREYFAIRISKNIVQTLFIWTIFRCKTYPQTTRWGFFFFKIYSYVHNRFDSQCLFVRKI